MTNSSLLFIAGVVLVLLPGSSTAFSPIAAVRTHASTTTSLRSITFDPPDDDNCEVDGTDCEESVFDQKRREQREHDDDVKQRYRAQGIELSDVDLYESVDQYQNVQTGGGLIPGMTLSALMEDD